MLGPPGQNWSAHVPQDLESRRDFYSRVSQLKSHPVNHIHDSFDPCLFNTIERSQSGARRGPNYQYHGMRGRPGGSCRQERPPHGQKPPTGGQGRGRPTNLSNRIPLPCPPCDMNRNHYFPEEYELLTHNNRAKPYLTLVPNSGSDIHFSDRSYWDISNVYPTSKFSMREPPNLDNDSWRSTIVPPPEMPYCSYSVPWGPPYHGPSRPLAPMMPTPHREAIQGNHDDIEIILGPEQESSSAFASAGASECAGNTKDDNVPVNISTFNFHSFGQVDKGRDRLREQLEFYFSPSNLAVDTFLGKKCFVFVVPVKLSRSGELTFDVTK